MKNQIFKVCLKKREDILPIENMQVLKVYTLLINIVLRKLEIVLCIKKIFLSLIHLMFMVQSYLYVLYKDIIKKYKLKCLKLLVKD